MTTLCRHCQKSLADCEEADKQLIMPLNPLIAKINAPAATYTYRFVKAFSYKSGCYDSESDTFYYVQDDVSYRYGCDIMLSLPLCVWETGEFWKDRQEIIVQVQKQNLNELPIEKDYITILYNIKPDAILLMYNLSTVFRILSRS